MENEEKKEQIRDEILNKIMDLLGKDDVPPRTVLVGEAGIGKTWLAEEVSKRVTQEAYIVLWLHLNKKIEDEKTLYQNLAAQLSLFFEYEEGANQNEVDDSSETLKKKISNEIIKTEKKNLLLILDDEGSMTTEEHVMEELKLRNFLEDVLKDTTLKILVTRRGEIQKEEESTTTIEVEPLRENESQILLGGSQGLLESYTVEDWPVLLKNLCESGEIKEPTLMSCIVSKSQGLPAAIVVLTKTLNSIKTLSAKQRKIFKELILSPKSLDAAAASKNAVDRSRYNPVLRLSYELLKPEEKMERPAVIACFWHVLDFYKYSGCAYYRDLIVHWMLEGYFDPVKSVEKAYQEGHSILMEFMNRGILKTQEDNTLVPEVSMRHLLDLEDCGFFGRSCLGFNRVYGGDKAKGLGRIILIDDMIRTIQSKNEKITTLIVSGNRLRREVPNKFFERKEMQHLEVVVLFDPTFHDLVQSLSKLKKLRVLVIRDCDLIKNIDELKDLTDLQVLEVSGASYLDDISDDLFKNITKLQSLNLSGLSIKSSPSTIENLSMLRCFILRDCPYLQDLPNFNVATKELEVIDIHGARDLKSYFDRVKSWKDYKGKNKNFAHLRNLEHLDFSGTQIIRLPIFHLKDSTNDFSTMPALKRLLVRNCTELRRLPQLKPLTKLQVLDVSGSKKLVEMLEVCLEKKDELRILNISETPLPELADTINDDVHLNQLLVRNCSAMKELPNIEKLTHLEVLDVSGCNKLTKIDGNFGKMSYLHNVNLSGTELSELPKGMSELANVRELIVRNCAKIESLPDLEKLIHLEILDVSGCSELKKIEGSFENMSYLCEVNLSGTKLKTFPELPKQSILCSSKRIVLSDSKFLDDDEWEKIKEKLEKDPEGSSFPSLADETEEEREKLVHHGDRYRVLDPEVPSGVQIVDTNRPVDDDMSKAEYVSVSDNESEKVSLILDKFKMSSVKGCWVERCKKMENLFESSPPSLEILWISNLPLLKKLDSGGNGGFKNLKKLSIDCCRNIETLFQGASQVPENLEILRVKFCDHLKKLFDVEETGELPNLRKLYLLDLPVLSSNGVRFQSLEKYTNVKCPRFKATLEELKMGTEKTEKEPSSKDQPHESHEDTAPEIQTPAESAKTTGPVQQQDKSSRV
ncbi:hypothetical protein Bca4012_023615 [Brassica carinata]